MRNKFALSLLHDIHFSFYSYFGKPAVMLLLFTTVHCDSVAAVHEVQRIVVLLGTKVSFT